MCRPRGAAPKERGGPHPEWPSQLRLRDARNELPSGAEIERPYDPGCDLEHSQGMRLFALLSLRRAGVAARARGRLRLGGRQGTRPAGGITRHVPCTARDPAASRMGGSAPGTGHPASASEPPCARLLATSVRVLFSLAARFRRPNRRVVHSPEAGNYLHLLRFYCMATFAFETILHTSTAAHSPVSRPVCVHLSKVIDLELT